MPEEFVKNFREDFNIKNTYHSNAIEGNTLTLYETKTVLEDGVTISGKSFREHVEANNHKEVIEYVKDLINDDIPLNQRTIKDKHAIVLQGIDRSITGSYRNTLALITGANHTPPSPDITQDEMDQLIQWYEDNEQLHSVEKASLLHTKFVNIHPFNEDNSRSIYFSGDSKGRFPNTKLQLLAYNERTEKGKKPVLAVSDKIKGGLFTADYDRVEANQVYLNKTKNEVEISNLAALIEKDLMEAVKELDASLS